MRYKYKLTFPYYSITFWDLKSLQSVPKTWQVLKTKKKFFKKMSKYRNTVFYDFKSRFLVLFSSNYRHRLVLKIPSPDYIFPKISKYGSENLHFPSNGKYYAPLKKKSVLKNFTKFAGKHRCRSLFFNKVAGLMSATLLTKKLWHRCFPVNFVKLLRTPPIVAFVFWKFPCR